MARTMTSATVGRVNTKFLLLALILAILSAVLAYAAVSQSGGGGSSAADIQVVVAVEPLEAGAILTEDVLTTRTVPADAVGEGPVTSIDRAVGEVLRFPLVANQPVLANHIASSSVITRNDVLSYLLERGQRGMAISTSVVVGAGGLVLPGDRVDILWLPDSPAEDTPALLLAENVEVVSVDQTLVNIPPAAPGTQTEDEEGETADGTRVRGIEADPIPKAVTVTLMVTPQQAQNLFCGESNGSIRLAVRPFGDTSASGLPPGQCVVAGEDGPQEEQQ